MNENDNIQQNTAEMCKGAVNIDQLTGLPLMRSYWDLVEDRIRTNPLTSTMMSVNIANFQYFNKWYGRDKGDALLAELGQYFQKLRQDYDLIAGYMGSDYFSVFFKEDQDLVDALIESVKLIVSRYMTDPLFRPFWGAYKYTENDTTNAIDMYDYTIMAMGKSYRYTYSDINWFSDAMAKDLATTVDLMPRIQRAMADDEFTIYLQPKCQIVDGRIVGAEALVRWINSAGETIMPGKFVSFLEKNGYITQLDQHIWEITCRTIRRWMDTGLPVLPVSINVSRIDIQNMDVVRVLTELVHKYQIPVSSLEIEITESAYVENESIVKEAEEALKLNGFKIIIDDFGSGYSSLNMLKDVDADVLKLDMRFLDFSNGNRGRGINIIYSIIDMARQIDLPIIVEGIETLEQIELLSMMGCEYVQGYYFYQPMSIENFEAIISDENNVATSNIHKRKMTRSYLQDITAYFWKVAEVNPWTGEYHFIKKSEDKDGVMGPRPVTIEDYVKRYVEIGMVHSSDKEKFINSTSMVATQLQIAKKQHRRRVHLRCMKEGRYVWVTFECIVPNVFSKNNPWVLYTWKIADTDVAVRQDTMNIIDKTFKTILKMDGLNGNCEIIQLDKDEEALGFHISKHFSTWNGNIIDNHLIHPDELEDYKEFTDIRNMTAKLAASDKPLKFQYRRRVGDIYHWVCMTVSRSLEYSDEHPVLMVMVQYINYLFEPYESAKYTTADSLKNLLSSLQFVIHLDITQERFVSSQDLATVEIETGIVSDDKYMVGVRHLVEKSVLPEYKDVYLAFMDRNWLLEKFGEGHTTLSLEYQRTVDGKPVWELILLLLYRDKTTGHLMATEYIYNIDSQKRIEMDLKASLKVREN
ncbi:EAL domain-containing protein [Anaerovibrio sp. RM50]|uniref:EAL domain-containing protein n=1 Tax=Anaerovibrio sp. RM50 TaxID=1200557 RepID=UPI0004820F03|nr:GGDEF domain-containing phosphodiesterase [Anaerovibrio sp. RM50]